MSHSIFPLDHILAAIDDYPIDIAPSKHLRGEYTADLESAFEWIGEARVVGALDLNSELAEPVCRDITSIPDWLQFPVALAYLKGLLLGKMEVTESTYGFVFVMKQSAHLGPSCWRALMAAGLAVYMTRRPLYLYVTNSEDDFYWKIVAEAFFYLLQTSGSSPVELPHDVPV